MASEHRIRLTDGRIVHAFDTGETSSDAFALLWHHGSPQTGAPLAPLLSAAADRGIRLLSYARPGYGGSTVQPGRTVASAASDVAAVAAALGVDRLAVMGASGGGPHALACAALLPDPVFAAVTFAGPAPIATPSRSEELDWFAGMAAPGGLRAALDGRAARAKYAETDEFDPAVFTAADWAALRGDWTSLGADAAKADAAGPEGLVDDDVAFAQPWGFDLSAIERPVLVVQGGEDRVVPPAHGGWLARDIGGSELWLRPHDGHVSILDAVPAAMDWLRTKAAQ